MNGGAPDLTNLGRVSAIVINWNGAADTIGLLQSLASAFARGLRAVIVDNGSSDDSAPRIEEFIAAWMHGPTIDLLPAADNLGFTAGVNLAVAHALAREPAPDYLLLLNPDGVAGEGTVEELVAVAEMSGADIVCPGGSVDLKASWPAAFCWPPPRVRRTAVGDRWQMVRLYGGACAMFRSDLVRALIARDGYFESEALFMYWDEWDVVLRSRSLGARVAVARDGRFDHLGPHRLRVEPAYRRFYGARNSVLVARANLSPFRFWPLFGLHLLRDITWLARLGLLRRGAHVAAYVEGTGDGLRGRGGRWRKHPLLPPANR